MEAGVFFAFGEGTSRLYQEVGISKHDAAIACEAKGGELSKGNAVLFGNGQSAVFANSNSQPSKFIWDGASNGLVTDVTESDQVHGPWGADGNDISGEFQSTFSGACQLSFVVYGMDSRDGEEDWVEFNDNVIWKSTLKIDFGASQLERCTSPWQPATGELANNLGLSGGCVTLSGLSVSFSVFWGANGTAALYQIA
jgi:hypothetical protein